MSSNSVVSRAPARRAAIVFVAAAAMAQPLFAQTAGGAPTIAITHANVVNGVDGTVLRDATILISAGRIVRVGTGLAAPADVMVIDLAGRWVAPGLIDAHTHIATLADARLGPLVAGVTTPEQLRAVVRVNLDHGVDWIKTRGTERAGLPDTDPRKQVYDERELRAIVEEAATRGIPVMAHAHGDEGAYAAVAAGVRSIEHGTYLSDSTLRLMRAKGAWLVPTLSTIVDLTQPGGDYDDPVLVLRGQHMAPRIEDTIRRAHAMGIRLATGADTDYGAESVTRIPHEVMRFRSLGLSPVEALAAATSGAAELLGIGARTGRVAEGFEADLIVLEGNPLEDAAGLQDVLVVVTNGRVALNRLPFGRRAPR